METSSDVDMQQRTQQKNNEKKNDKIKYTHQIVIYIQYHTYITRGNQLIALAFAAGSPKLRLNPLF
jgi:hypothetical protein